MKNGKKWATADAIVGILGGIFGILGIVTGIKSSKYQREQQYADLETRYGLVPVNENGDEAE